MSGTGKRLASGRMDAAVEPLSSVSQAEAAGGVSAHGDGCECTRCVGFEPGHTLSVRHGAYSRRLLADDAEKLTAELEQAVPEASPPAIALAAIVWAQVFRAAKVLAEAADGSDHAELKRDLHRWAGRAESLFARLGLVGDKDGGVINIGVAIQQSSEWQTMQARITAALRQHPAALVDVLAALEEAGDVAQS